MLWLRYVGVLALAYLLGAIPVGYVIARLIRGIDIRRIGSGHTGGTNVLRSAGPVAAGLTVLADLAKGYAAVALARAMLPGVAWVAALAAVLAVLGHNRSIFMGWRGGVGSMTTVGATLGLMPLAAGIIVILGAIIIAVWRYSSLASLTAAGLLPILCLIGVVWGVWPPIYLLFACLSSALSVWELRSNIARLRLGTERRVGQAVAPGATDVR